ncbi:4-hydroxyphenylpyruvate dioxygenase [Roseobacter denitrificans]|uniref:4-hydroxyphenylpyruvate dioxygenase n=1 Tax=Roseobacter denitrificans (strain ATCC 33942 / OCh 114) TaxID=375451 RepID=Q168Z7_ROSDO|nr:4-hydroxyphenylpyruvate dioxygenase [Roseobacter denitrificans]ABG31446.1 4-hydroxyphenylpyruvate dioxygenase [Roseobacter denitrificans OCh 114]AVL54458.1 4-hydroxyphenylpyruvate dioxygenase [Roseobacter denitrificans]SFG01490.1 4-hydroxyphenylpyruvate dioxygenase [Roseobacter denitrificans OCh 114]
MGPFPHNAPKSQITEENPVGTDGFEFVEFSHPEPEALRRLFAQMGYRHVATHKTRQIELWQQGDITYVLNADPDSFAAGFVQDHGPCAPSMGWRVADAQVAFDHAVSKGAVPYEGSGKVLDVPAIIGIGGSLLYFVDQYHDTSPYNAEYDWLQPSKPAGVGFYYLDHLTHNVHKGNMDKWFRFYRDLFNFREVRFFDIEGKYTGLLSRALTSPCGRIRIPINEDRGETGQIVSYLRKYKGEGIQHIAVGAHDIYDSTDAIAVRGVKFMPGPPDSYYALSHERVAGHEEPIDRMKAHGILIDGEGVVDGGETKILLQIFSKTVIGPIFFEFIQRKGDDGFGEGNFKALFESIEQEQIAIGEIAAE